MTVHIEVDHAALSVRELAPVYLARLTLRRLTHQVRLDYFRPHRLGEVRRLDINWAMKLAKTLQKVIRVKRGLCTQWLADGADQDERRLVLADVAEHRQALEEGLGVLRSLLAGKPETYEKLRRGFEAVVAALKDRGVEV
jgi:hypothetical protein